MNPLTASVPLTAPSDPMKAKRAGARGEAEVLRTLGERPEGFAEVGEGFARQDLDRAGVPWGHELVCRGNPAGSCCSVSCRT